MADGAMGTMLFDRGLQPGACPESVTLSHPEMLGRIAQLYLDAGADILTTNTFGASPARLSTYGLEDKTEVLNETAVRVIRDVVGDRAYVAGSCGPSGKLLEPYGDAKPDDLYEGFCRQAGSLAAAGVDCVFVETMVDLAEARLAVRAVKDTAPNIPVAACMTFDPTPKGYYSVMGVSVAAAAAGLAESGAEAVGSNCGNGSENMVEVAREFKEATDLPVIIQPNAGMPQTEGGRIVYDETPDYMATAAKELVALGIAVIGGCCGTTPEHIAAIRAVVDERWES
ncbi:MAG: homocysteine S-methyltransferase family protein [Gemmatimonadota bacterium]|nr:MAG: homocysteine S-methyltransferase family protein [Gemmatimonadota bacterium]